MIYKKDSIVKLLPEGGQALRTLPFGAYTIELTQSGIILAEMEMPDRIPLVGLAEQSVRICSSSWNALPENVNMSAMFTGISGTGKSKSCIAIAHELQLPIIYCFGTPQGIIMDVLSYLDGPVMLFFDEFEKNYNKDQSEALLPMFDGLKTPVKVFFAITMNETSGISRYMINRPGRVRYDFKFNAVTVQEAMEFISSRASLSEKDMNKVTSYFTKINDLSWDIVDKVMETILLVGTEALPYLNVTTGRLLHHVDLAVGDHVYYSTLREGNNFCQVVRVTSGNIVLGSITFFIPSEVLTKLPDGDISPKDVKVWIENEDELCIGNAFNLSGSLNGTLPKELSLKKHSSLNQAVRKVLGNKITLYSERRITGYVSQSYSNIAY